MKKIYLAIGFLFLLLFGNMNYLKAEAEKFYVLNSESNLIFRNGKQLEIDQSSYYLGYQGYHFDEDGEIYININDLGIFFNIKDVSESSGIYKFSLGENNFTLKGAKLLIEKDGTTKEINEAYFDYNDYYYVRLDIFAKDILGYNISFYDKGFISIYQNKDPLETNTQQERYHNLFFGVKKIENMEKYIQFSKFADYYYDDSYVVAESSGDKNERSITIPNHSVTNNQVEEVYEGDISITDGKYIYTIVDEKVKIIDIRNPEKMNIERTIEPFKKMKNIKPIEIFLKDNILVIVGEYVNKTVFDTYEEYEDIIKNDFSKVAIASYNLSDMNNVKKIRNFYIDGFYVASRIIDNKVHLITSSQIFNVLPEYYDDVNDEVKKLSLENIYYFNKVLAPNIVSMMQIDFSKMSKPAIIDSYLINARDVFVTKNNLFIIDNKNNSSIIYKFDLEKENKKFINSKKVIGDNYSRYSLGEYENNIHIVTEGYMYIKNDKVLTSGTFLHILDKDLNELGKLNAFTKNENIKSVKSVNDRLYVVTFRDVDPLFSIDISDPTNPFITGELKVPGFSKYLHQIDKNYLFGFGMNVSEKNSEDGLKLSLFDISDEKNIKEKFNEVIFASMINSNLLDDPKQIIYDNERNILGFSVALFGYKDKKNMNSQNRFVGVIIYKIDFEKGFIELGKISHTPKDENKSIFIEKVIYVGNIIYTISNGEIKSTYVDTMETAGNIFL